MDKDKINEAIIKLSDAREAYSKVLRDNYITRDGYHGYNLISEVIIYLRGLDTTQAQHCDGVIREYIERPGEAGEMVIQCPYHEKRRGRG